MEKVKHVRYGSVWKSLVGVVVAGLAALTVFIGFTPAGAASTAGSDATNQARECPPYFVAEFEEGTTFLVVRPEDCNPPQFLRPCGARLFVLNEVVAADREDLCAPERWPDYSCSLSFISEPTVVPDDFCNPAAWPDDSCGVIIHSTDENETFAPCDGDLEGYRQYAVDEMVSALESYKDEHGTFLVTGTGFKGTGHGWGFYEGHPKYVRSIASVLRDGGHLVGEPVHDPLWTGSTSVVGDVLVYRCKDRVAVFTREGNGQPTAEDRAWWNDNKCFRYPINGLKAKYFKLSEGLEPS